MKPESKVDTTQIEWSLCTVSIILYLIQFEDCHIASILSICNWIFYCILFTVRPSLTTTQPFGVTRCCYCYLLFAAAAACFMLLSVWCAYVLENVYWFFPRFWWRQRNEDTSIGPEWFAPSFYWIPYYVSHAQTELGTYIHFRTLPSVLRQCKWQIIFFI